jgi:amino acid adenylation domain-containing protein/non-ribosomal peptide synthase protein (TIGR01720 family)
VFQITTSYFLNEQGLAIVMANPDENSCNPLLPIHYHQDETPTFQELLKNTQKQFAEAFNMAVYPLSLLPEYSTESLGDILLIYTKQHTEIPKLNHWKIIFRVYISNDSMEIDVKVSPLIFTEKMLNQWKKCFEDTLKLTIESSKIPNQTLIKEMERHSLSDVSLLYPDSPPRQVERNFPNLPYQSLTEAFEAKVHVFPDNIALVFQDRNLTYSELQNKVIEIAKKIQALLPSPNHIIAVKIPPSIELITVILGILKSGNAYLPLDTEAPQERNDFILKDSGASLLIESPLTSEGGTSSLSFGVAGQEVRLIPPPGVRGLCYIIYTSGTTGQPKGCMISHSNVLNLLCNPDSPFDFHEKDVWILAHSIAFDFSVWEMYGALLHGGKLIIPTREQVRDTAQFWEIIRREGVTILNQTPQAFSSLTPESPTPTLPEGEGTTPPSGGGGLRLIIFGGDKLQPHKLKPWVAKYPLDKVRLVNMYGITETTVHVTYHFLTEADLAMENSSVIGKPLPNVQVWITDKSGNMLPKGVVGEMRVLGAGVGMGYRSPLSPEGGSSPLPKGEEIEVGQSPSHFGEGWGGAFYRTGDLALLNENGDLEYIGRKDKQVKIRGYRIELGEIDFHLRQAEGIKDCLITTFVHDENTSLIAYYVSEKGISKDELHTYSARKLPHYMLPSYWVQIDKIPLNINGKPDLGSLPSPFATLNVASSEDMSETEKQLSEVWQSVLGFENIQLDTHFFRSGGDSIKALQIISRIQSKGYKLEMRDIFEFPVLCDLAKRLKPIDKKIISEQAAFSSNLHLTEAKQFLENQNIFQEIEAIYPLAPTQAGLLWQALVKPDSTAYCEQLYYEVAANLDIQKLSQAYQDLIKRHTILRTVFWSNAPDAPLQIVLTDGFIEFYTQSIQHLSNQDSQAWIREYIQQDLAKNYALEQDALMRLAVFDLGENRWGILWSHHHILLDGWCLQLLISDFFKLYQGENLPKPIPFSDYLHWLHSFDRDSAKEFWNKYLQDFTEISGLPIKTKIPENENLQTYSYQFSNEGFTDLVQFCQDSSITLNTALQSIWGLILQRLNQQNDVVFGRVASGRPPQIEGIEQMIGLFINTLPTRVQTNDDSTFAQVAQIQQENNLQTEGFQYLSLAEIQKCTKIDEPLFNHIFVFENYPVDFKNNEGVKIFYQDNYEQTHFDLTLVFFVSNERLHLRVLFNEQKLSEYFIEQLPEIFENIIHQIAPNPNLQIKDIYLIKSTNQADFDTISETDLLADLIIQPNPNCEDKRVIIRRYLREVCGLADHDTVEISLPRNEYLQAAFLACLDLGVQYIPSPLNPKGGRYKGEGVNFIIDEELIEKCFASHHSFGACRAVRIVLPPGIRGLGIAYFIFTSGSTGQPKCIEISRNNLANLILWAKEEYKNTPIDTILAGTSVNFDLSVFELIVGHCLDKNVVILESNLDILHNLHYPNILINTVPSVLQYLKDNQADLSNVQAVNTAGEPVSESVIQWLQTYPHIEIRNLYAPSETTTYSTCYHFPKDDAEVFIGYPILNTTIDILDQYGFPLPVGAWGEIVIGGGGVAKYSPLTSGGGTSPFYSGEGQGVRQFPLRGVGGFCGASFYFTADIARYDETGRLEYGGRRDDQIKRNGYRIELGEIEYHLSQITHSKTAVLFTDGLLIAFTESPPTYRGGAASHFFEEGLRVRLSELLPDYMLPQNILQIEKIPLNPNGKTDKKALKKLWNELPKAHKEIQLPTHEAEKLLVDIWQKLLQKEKISIDDNFFRLGGDSIQAMQMVAQARKVGYALQVKDIFQYPILKDLALNIKQSTTDTQQLFLLRGLGGLLSPIECWFFENYTAHVHHFNQSVFLQIDFDINSLIIKEIIEYLGKTHTALRQKFVKTEEGWQRGDLAEVNRFYHINSSFISRENAAIEIENEANKTQRSLQIEQGKLVAIQLFDINGNTHILFVIHHLAIDGVSWRIFLEDFLTTFHAMISENPLPTIFTTDSQEDYLIHLKKYLENKSPLPPKGGTVIVAPKKEYGTEITEHNSIHQKIEKFPLRGLGGFEINDILLSALALAFYEWNRSQEILINLEGHGREPLIGDLDLSRTIGWFTAIFPVHLKVVETDLLKQLIQTKETLRQIPDKGTSYGVWKYWEKAESYQDQPEICFNYLGQFDELQTKGVKLSPYAAGEAVAPENPKLYALEFNAMVVNQAFNCSLNYDIEQYSDEDAHRLLDLFLHNLQKVMAFCQSQTETVYTPSDFGAADLSMEDLEAIQDLIGGIEE